MSSEWESKKWWNGKRSNRIIDGSNWSLIWAPLNFCYLVSADTIWPRDRWGLNNYQNSNNVQFHSSFFSSLFIYHLFTLLLHIFQVLPISSSLLALFNPIIAPFSVDVLLLFYQSFREAAAVVVREVALKSNLTIYFAPNCRLFSFKKKDFKSIEEF